MPGRRAPPSPASLSRRARIVRLRPSGVCYRRRMPWEPARRRLRAGGGLAVVFVAYTATARLGLSFDALGGVATTVWPPTRHRAGGAGLARRRGSGRSSPPPLSSSMLAHGRSALGRRRSSPPATPWRRSSARRCCARLGVRRRARARCGTCSAGRVVAAFVSTMVSATFGLLAAGSRARASVRDAAGLLGGLVGGRCDGRPAGRAAPLRLGDRSRLSRRPIRWMEAALLGAVARLRGHGRCSVACFRPARSSSCAAPMPMVPLLDLGGAAVRAARDHRGAPAGGDLADRRLGLAGVALRRRPPARAAADGAELHGGHGGQHADVGRGAGRAPRRDRRARRVHLHRLTRAQDAAHGAQAAARVGDARRRASRPAPRRRPARLGWRALGASSATDRSAGEPGRQSARRLPRPRGPLRAAHRAGRHRRARCARSWAGCASRRRRSVRRIELDHRRDGRRHLGSQPHRAGGDEPALERHQVRPGAADRGVGWTARRRASACGSRIAGMGISRADQTRIFQAFERLPTPRRVGGLGLGLYIGRQIAVAHGGTLTVESDAGRGRDLHAGASARASPDVGPEAGALHVGGAAPGSAPAPIRPSGARSGASPSATYVW